MLDLLRTDSDLQAIAPAHLDSLRWAKRYPSRYTQRLVESVEFPASGGQLWRRSVQIRLPPIAPDASPDSTRSIVSLGMFERFRFADLVVRDEKGHRQALVTRQQHGFLLSHLLLRQFITNPELWAALASPQRADQQLSPTARDLFQSLYWRVNTVVTSTADLATLSTAHKADFSQAQVRRDVERLWQLLAQTFPSDPAWGYGSEAGTMLAAFYGELVQQTEYFCWVTGLPGETVRLDVSYTTPDNPNLQGPLVDSRKTPARLASVRQRLQDGRASLYAHLGIMPLMYEFRAPSHDHVGSYYFSVKPPDDTEVIMLDWGRGRRFQTTPESGADGSHNPNVSGVLCGHITCHVNNGETQRAGANSISGSKIHAFVRARPVDHANLLAIALVTLALCYLHQEGALLATAANASRGQWLLFAPLGMIAFLAAQRKHYYGTIMRPLRTVFWGYTAVLGLFAASAGFLERGGLMSGRLALVSSILLVTTLAFSGHIYTIALRRRFRAVFARSRLYGGAWSPLRRLQRAPFGWPLQAERQARLEIEEADDGTRAFDTARMFHYVARSYADAAVICGLLIATAAVCVVASPSWGRGWTSRTEAVRQVELQQRRACHQSARAHPQVPLADTCARLAGR